MFGDEGMFAVYQRELNIGELEEADGRDDQLHDNEKTRDPSVEMVEEA